MSRTASAKSRGSLVRGCAPEPERRGAVICGPCGTRRNPVLVETQDVTNLRRTIGQVRAPAKGMAPEGGSTRVGQGLGCGRCVCGRSCASALKPHSVFLSSGQPTLLTVVCAPATHFCLCCSVVTRGRLVQRF